MSLFDCEDMLKHTLFCILKYTQKLFSTTTTLKMSTITVVNDNTDPTSGREQKSTAHSVAQC